MTARNLYPWLVAAAYMASLFWLSSLPKLPEPEGLPGRDKTEHFVAYAGLAVVLFWALRSSSRGMRPAAAAVGALAIAAAYGAFDELHQSLVPDRTCCAADWLSDVLGATAGAVISLYAVRSGSWSARWRGHRDR